MFFVVSIFVAVDVVILIVATSLSVTRLKPEVIPDKEFGNTTDVRIHIYIYIYGTYLHYHLAHYMYDVDSAMYEVGCNACRTLRSRGGELTVGY